MTHVVKGHLCVWTEAWTPRVDRMLSERWPLMHSTFQELFLSPASWPGGKWLGHVQPPQRVSLPQAQKHGANSKTWPNSKPVSQHGPSIFMSWRFQVLVPVTESAGRSRTGHTLNAGWEGFTEVPSLSTASLPLYKNQGHDAGRTHNWKRRSGYRDSSDMAGISESANQESKQL